jgi:hypothetical protein
VEQFCAVVDGRLKWYETVSVGSLGKSSRTLRQSQIPGYLKGPSLSRNKKALYVLETVFAGDIELLRSLKLNPFLPREIGGGGFPCTEEQEVAAWQALRPNGVRAVRAVMGQGAMGWWHMNKLSGAWDAAPRTRSQVQASELVKSILVLEGLMDQDEKALTGNAVGRLANARDERRSDRQEEDSGMMRMTLEEIKSELELTLVPAVQLMDGFETCRPVVKGLGTLKRDVAKAVKEVSQLVPTRLGGPVRNLRKGWLRWKKRRDIEGYMLPSTFRANPALGTVWVVLPKGWEQ